VAPKVAFLFAREAGKGPRALGAVINLRDRCRMQASHSACQ